MGEVGLLVSAELGGGEGGPTVCVEGGGGEGGGTCDIGDTTGLGVMDWTGERGQALCRERYLMMLRYHNDVIIIIQILKLGHSHSIQESLK